MKGVVVDGLLRKVLWEVVLWSAEGGGCVVVS